MAEPFIYTVRRAILPGLSAYLLDQGYTNVKPWDGGEEGLYIAGPFTDQERTILRLRCNAFCAGCHYANFRGPENGG